MRQSYRSYTLESQQGIGLIEVMVSLLLLAVAILGFTAMQMSAVKATDESLVRTRALTILRGGAEIIRLNPSQSAIDSFSAGVNGTNTTISVDGSDITSASCMGSGSCTASQLAARDGLAIRQHAIDNNLNVRLMTCPQTGVTATSTGQNVQCFVASWGTTAPVLGDTPPDASTGHTLNCADSQGVYNSGAQCFIMEAY